MEEATILVVDDEVSNRDLLVDSLTDDGYTVFAAESAAAALDLLTRTAPDLLLVDIMMPGMDGIELCRRLKGEPATRLLPVVLVTALHAPDDRVRGIDAGADDFLSKPVRMAELRARVRSLVRLKRYTDQLDHAEAALYSLALGVEAKDPALESHCMRLSRYSTAMGEALGLGEAPLEALRRGGVLHDLGKIGIPDAILLKPGPLTPDEWKVMREHPVIGERICQPLKSMQAVLPIIRHHHERWNGSGYPDGLAGPAIPLTARILQVADVFDALTTKRPYRQPMTPADALGVLQTEASQGWMDITLVDLFTRLWAAGTLQPDRGHIPDKPTRAHAMPVTGSRNSPKCPEAGAPPPDSPGGARRARGPRRKGAMPC